MGTNIQSDWEYYWSGQEHASAVTKMSFLEPTGVSQFTRICALVIFTLSVCGLLSAILLCFGLFLEMKTLLIPWIFNITISSIIDISHSFFWLIVQPRADFNPVAAMLFTIEIFVLLLNVYAVLCVFSQYQEFKAGRGTAAYNEIETIRRRGFTVSAMTSSTPHTTPTSYQTGCTSQSVREAILIIPDNSKIRKVRLPNEELSTIQASSVKLQIGNYVGRDKVRDARITPLKEEDTVIGHC